MGYDSEDAYSSDSPSSSSSPAKKGRNLKAGLRGVGSSLSSTGQGLSDRASAETSSSIHAVQYRKGGKVRKTGMAKVHKNERVIPAGKRKKVERLMKRSGIKMRAGR